MDMEPKQAERQFAFKEDAYVQNQHYLGTSHGLITGESTAWESQPENHHQQINRIPPEGLFTIMQKQNEITAALVHQQRLLSLPARDIPIFDGDLFQYKAFIKAFEQGVENKACKADCLYYLEQFTKGQPQELVRSCQHMAPERGYIVAKGLLQEHFGNEYKIAAAYIGKALAWPTITKAEDIKALQAYALFLRGCANVMEELQYMQELDMPSNMKMVVFKLPYKLREQWRNKVHNIMEASNNRAHFIDLVKVIERHVRVLSDPIFGDIGDSGHKSVAIKSSNMFQPQSKNRMKGSSFAATVFPMSEVGIKMTNNSKPQESHCVIVVITTLTFWTDASSSAKGSTETKFNF